MKYFLLLTLACLSFTWLQGQDFRSGYVVTTKNDTIQGLIEFAEGSPNFIKCKFKRGSNDPIVAYSPEELKSYRFTDDKYYETRVIAQTAKVSKVFLEVLIRGNVTIYKYIGTYYVEKGDTTLIELKNNNISVMVNGQRFTKESKEYIKTLNILFSDCQDVREKIQKLVLTNKSLIQLAESYNRCVGSPILSYTDKKKWISVNWTIMTGYNTSELTLNSTRSSLASSSLTSGVYQSGGSITFGASIEIGSPRKRENLTYVIGLLYTAVRAESNERIFGTSTTADVNFSQMSLPIGFKYTALGGSIRPLFGGGLVYSLTLDSKSQLVRTINNGTQTFMYKDNDPLGKNYLGYYFNVGANFSITKKVNGFLEVRRQATTTSDFSQTASPNGSQGSAGSSIGSWIFLLGVRF